MVVRQEQPRHVSYEFVAALSLSAVKYILVHDLPYWLRMLYIDDRAYLKIYHRRDETVYTTLSCNEDWTWEILFPQRRLGVAVPAPVEGDPNEWRLWRLFAVLQQGYANVHPRLGSRAWFRLAWNRLVW